MDYVAPLGIPVSEFFAWDEYDQDAAIAWQRDKHSRCPGCGTHDDDWWDEKKRKVMPPPYEVEGVTCAVCEAMDEFRQREDVQKNASGLHMTLRRVDPLDFEG